MKTPLYCALSLAIVAVVLTSCAKPRATVTASHPLLVQVAPVVYSDAAVPIRVPGVLSRKTEAELSFKIGGLVDTVAVRAGDTVVAGQMLARLRLDEIDAQVSQARTALEKARRDFARVEKLQSKHVATLENLQDAGSVVDVATAQLRIAEFNQRYAVIAAPKNGRVLQRMVEPGEFVTSGKAIIEFASDGDGWIVRAGLAERDIARVRVGDVAEIAIDDRNSVTLAGHISQVSEATDASTRTIPVEILLDSAPTTARSGSVVVATIHPARVAPRPLVPASVLIEGTDSHASLFLVGNDVPAAAHRVNVEIEAMDGDRVFLRTAIPAAARLVVQGAEYLREGSPVEIKP